MICSAIIFPFSEILKGDKMPKILLIDLDGVLNTYNGNYSESEIAPPREGVNEFLKAISQTYKIEIFTVRDKKSTQKWLEKYNLSQFISNITNVKNPRASIIIDDRALQFKGDFQQTLQDITNFKPHWKNL